MAGLTVLLDTNILLAALIDPDTLPVHVQQDLRDPENTVLFSAVSIWEIAIKSGQTGRMSKGRGAAGGCPMGDVDGSGPTPPIVVAILPGVPAATMRDPGNFGF